MVAADNIAVLIGYLLGSFAVFAAILYGVSLLYKPLKGRIMIIAAVCAVIYTAINALNA